jgi:very-short-patch-repair endonuclease
VAVEIDGFAFHSTRDRFENDRRRDARLRQAGITVIRITWRQLERESEAVIADVAGALARAAR